MADSVLTELNFRPRKIPKLQKASDEESNSSSKQRELRGRVVEDDEYLRQYMLYYYQFEKTEIRAKSPKSSEIWARDIMRRGKLFKILIFRLNKPIDQVEPPSPLYYDDLDRPPVVFARAGPEGVPFVFSRNRGRSWSCS